MQVFLGNYVNLGDNGTAYMRQRDVIKGAIQTYGVDNILGPANILLKNPRLI